MGRTTTHLDANQAGGVHCPIRLVRFARVLGEPVDSFRYCHTSQFSTAVGRYFGDFAVCPQCLGEGYHCVLFSFKALRECPVHRTEFWHRNGDKAIPSPKLFNELLKPYVRYGREQQDLEYATARLPKANAQRDGALGEIADWLMDIGLRYWIGTPGVRIGDVPLQDFAERIVHLKTAMGLAGAEPSWVTASDYLPLDPATMEIAKFGTMKVSAKCVHDKDDRGGNRRNIDLNLYYKTLLCDFKAIHRYIKRQIPAKARRWLARLSVAVDAPDIGALLQMGGPNAWHRLGALCCGGAVRANTVSIRRPVLLADPIGWHSTQPFQPGATSSRPNPSLAPVPDFAHIWLVRWISAAGLLRFWCSVRDVVAHQSHHRLAATGIRTSTTRLEPHWGIGVSADNVLTLCFSNGEPDALVHAGTLL
jgi:hypothetical protein